MDGQIKPIIIIIMHDSKVVISAEATISEGLEQAMEGTECISYYMGHYISIIGSESKAKLTNVLPFIRKWEVQQLLFRS